MALACRVGLAFETLNQQVGSAALAARFCPQLICVSAWPRRAASEQTRRMGSVLRHAFGTAQLASDEAAEPSRTDATEIFNAALVRSRNGRCDVWSVSVEVGEAVVIFRRWGCQGGKMQTNKRVVTESRHAGRANERCPRQVAVDQAKSWMRRKIDAGYTSIDGGVASGRHELPAPMLAKTFSKAAVRKFRDQSGKSTDGFVAMLQPKLDGIRCTVKLECASAPVLYSRQGKMFAGLAHLDQDFEELLDAVTRNARRQEHCLSTGCLYLDGELYSHDPELGFQQIVSCVKRQKRPEKALVERVEFHAFDCFHQHHDAMPFKDRSLLLSELIGACHLQHLFSVETKACTSFQDIEDSLDVYTRDGYEGVMIRDPLGIYRPGMRSDGLLKYKRFDDNEFVVVGYHEGKGRAKGTIIFICETGDKRQFSVSIRGTTEARREAFRSAQDDFEGNFLNKRLTVRHQGFSDDGKPRFPVGIAFRDYE
eukprot:CAMPEP_0117612018 /NCGR_PEP_ID=MMETSP0784-20121206/82717_1 /TAXON_ID=39447 /ORGANISM="" /LENGTH=480 /DNA_ID=CAMNT_0005415529 /DNA_START=239 /DNA_END=1682 /DNA_ORIENTATION=-